MEVAASIIAILQISGKVIGYIQTASGSKTDRNRLRDAVRQCSDILQELKDNVDDSEAEKAWIERIRILDQPGGPLHRLRSTLSQVQTRLQSDGFASKLRWPFQEKDMMKLIGAIESEKSLLQLALTNNTGRMLHEVNAKSQENTKQLVELTRMLQLQADASQDMSLKLDDLGVSQSSIHSGVEALHNRDQVREDAQERKEILAWLSKADHSSSFHDAIQKRHDTTCTWFLESREYILWKNTKGKTLFCPGMPGAGKTILASVVIADLCESYKSEPSYGIAFLFNIFNEYQSSKELLASLFQQLVKRQEHLPVPIKKFYKRHDHGQKPMHIQDITEGIRTMASSLQRVFLVVDALDECNPNSIRDLLSTIFLLRDVCNINILATSRDIPTITFEFEGADVLEISARDKDIRHFVRGKSHQLGNIVRRDPKLLEEAAVKIAGSAQGMFLLAQLHVDSLSFKRSKKAFRDALQTLSSGQKAYDTAYEAAMERINGQTKEQAQFATEALSWVTQAKRPLFSYELCEALAVEDQALALDPDNLPCLDDILSVCAGLLVVDKGTYMMRLVHYTAQEYLDRNTQKWFPNGQMILAKTCITYLSLSTFSEPQPKHKFLHWRRQQRRSSLYRYAVKYWAVHAGSSDISQIESAILKLLNQPENVQRALEELSFGHISGATGLHLAIWSGFHDAVTLLLRHGFDSNAGLEIDSWHETPLTIAASHGHTSIAKLLISNGAKMDTEPTAMWSSFPMDTEPTAMWSSSPIQIATIGGHKEIVKLLIPGSAVRDVQLSLCSAIRKRSRSLCELLLERAPVAPDDGFTPLHDAASERDTHVVALLLDKRSPKNARDGDGQTPLFRAAARGYRDVIRQLLKANATVDIADASSQTPLHVAIQRGYAGVVELLLLAGADIELQNDDHDSAISLAAKSPRGIMAKLIPRALTDAVWRDEVLSSLIFTAAQQGNKAWTARLLDSGADLHSSDKDGLSPLMWAVAEKHLTLAKYLLQRGAKVSKQDEKGRTSLMYSLDPFQKDLVELLLDFGADVDSRDDYGRTLLHIVVAADDNSLIEYVLRKGANINLRDNAGCTALWLACKAGNDFVACKLLRFGADWQIANHAGVDIQTITSNKDLYNFWRAVKRLETHEAIAELMRKRRAEKALLASENQSHVEAEEEIA